MNFLYKQLAAFQKIAIEIGVYVVYGLSWRQRTEVSVFQVRFDILRTKA